MIFFCNNRYQNTVHQNNERVNCRNNYGASKRGFLTRKYISGSFECTSLRKQRHYKRVAILEVACKKGLCNSKYTSTRSRQYQTNITNGCEKLTNILEFFPMACQLTYRHTTKVKFTRL